MIPMRIKRPTTPTSDALVTRTVDGYKCLICSVVCGSEDQISGHMAGKRHAQNLAFMEALGSDRWRGDPNYSAFNFWNTVSDLVPDYPCRYPSIPLLCSSAVVESVRNETLDSPQVSCIVRADSPMSPDMFFASMYQCRLARDEYVCELCGNVPMVGRFSFIDHLKSECHSKAVFELAAIDCDYFQPVYNPDSGRVFFVGLVSRTLVMYAKFFQEHSSLLFDQWSLLDKLPSAESALLQLSPQEAINIYALVV